MSRCPSVKAGRPVAAVSDAAAAKRAEGSVPLSVLHGQQTLHSGLLHLPATRKPSVITSTTATGTTTSHTQH